MSPKLLVAMAGAVGTGVVIGCIPFVNEHLHWSIWVVLPVSGMMLGLLFGWLQGKLSVAMNIPVVGTARNILILAGALAYLGTDLGYFMTTTVEFPARDGQAARAIHLSDVMSFSAYMLKVRLGSHTSTIYTHGHGERMEQGATWTRVEFAVDMLGCLLGTLAGLLIVLDACSFCEECRRYKKQTGVRVFSMSLDQAQGNEVIKGLAEVMPLGHAQLVAALPPLASRVVDKGGNCRFTVAELVCDSCQSSALLTKLERLVGNEWKLVDGFTSRKEAPPGTGEKLPGIPSAGGA